MSPRAQERMSLDPQLAESLRKNDRKILVGGTIVLACVIVAAAVFAAWWVAAERATWFAWHAQIEARGIVVDAQVVGRRCKNQTVSYAFSLGGQSRTVTGDACSAECHSLEEGSWLQLRIVPDAPARVACMPHEEQWDGGPQAYFPVLMIVLCGLAFLIQMLHRNRELFRPGPGR